ncbi:MAG: bifunctional diguanylate cyclase/phosphodiesterase [Nitrospirae bacterium]|nr:bifunctional diguanylate cyclase/phosphodiesterase [Nitrospirota bacterium]
MNQNVTDYNLNPKFRSAFVILFIYLVVGGAWLLISEYLGSELFGKALKTSVFQNYNLSLFIVVNGLFIFLLSIGKIIAIVPFKSLRNQSLLDPLTDLPNRALFCDRLQQALMKAQRENQAIAVLVIGVSRLREIHNSLGHRYRDLTLKEIGLRLQKLIRLCDTISRVEEYQIGVFLTNCGAEGAIRVAGNILKVMEEPLILDGLTLEVELNIGISLYPYHTENDEQLLRCAQVARVQAKEEGTGYAMYTLQKDQHATQTLTLLGELRQSIDHNELFMVYQPKIDLKAGRVVGVEALVRWNHPQRGLIPPDQFIPMAENSGLIKPLSIWIINNVLGQCQAWQKSGIEIPVAINLSRRNLHDPNLFNHIVERLKHFEIRHDLLELEITESIIMANVSAAIKILSRLNDIGIKLSIDDFGTGYSSLGSLKRLPVNITKIDKSFVINMATDKDDETIVRSTIDLAHNLGLKVVAEGVENQETWNGLAAMGCDELQGYFISRPLLPVQLIEWLGNSPWGLGEKNNSVQPTVH